MVDKLVTHLVMASPGQLRPSRRVDGLEVVAAEPAGVDAERLRRLHDLIATPHHWSSLERSQDAWRKRATAEGRRHRIARVGGEDVGWACLEVSSEGVEVTSFGIRPDVVGRGLGGLFLAEVVREAWDIIAEVDRVIDRRVWLHTSSWDHPYALPNYLARGFRVERVEISELGADDNETRPVERLPRFLTRPGVAADARQIVPLLEHLGYERSIDTVRRRVARLASSRDDVIAVAVEHGEELVGVISAHIVPPFAERHEAFARITALAVASAVARRGVGRLLTEFVEYAVQRRGVGLLEVSSGRRPEREAVHRLYEALGFRETSDDSARYWKEIKTPSPRPDDALGEAPGATEDGSRDRG